MIWKTEREVNKVVGGHWQNLGGWEMGANCTSEMVTVRSYGEEKEQPVPSTTGLVAGRSWEQSVRQC